MKFNKPLLFLLYLTGASVAAPIPERIITADGALTRDYLEKSIARGHKAKNRAYMPQSAKHYKGFPESFANRANPAAKDNNELLSGVDQMKHPRLFPVLMKSVEFDQNMDPGKYRVVWQDGPGPDDPPAYLGVVAHVEENDTGFITIHDGTEAEEKRLANLKAMETKKPIPPPKQNPWGTCKRDGSSCALGPSQKGKADDKRAIKRNQAGKNKKRFVATYKTPTKRTEKLRYKARRRPARGASKQLGSVNGKYPVVTGAKKSSVKSFNQASVDNKGFGAKKTTSAKTNTVRDWNEAVGSKKSLTGIGAKKNTFTGFNKVKGTQKSRSKAGNKKVGTR